MGSSKVIIKTESLKQLVENCSLVVVQSADAKYYKLELIVEDKIFEDKDNYRVYMPEDYEELRGPLRNLMEV